MNGTCMSIRWALRAKGEDAIQCQKRSPYRLLNDKEGTCIRKKEHIGCETNPNLYDGFSASSNIPWSYCKNGHAETAMAFISIN